MPKRFPEEFKRDAVAVARRGGRFRHLPSPCTASCARRTSTTGSRTGWPGPSRLRSCSSGATSAGSRWRTRSCGGRPPPSPAPTPKMRFPLVRELAADGDLTPSSPLGAAFGHRQAPTDWDGNNSLGQGWSIPKSEVRALLKAHHLTGSMGRVAAAGDNPPMESFHSLLQKNVFNRRRWRTRAEAHFEIARWIEHTYNRRRRQRGLGRLTPVEFDLAFTRRDVAA